MPTSSVRAVTFDFGQTLFDLDTAFLSRRLAERGVTVQVERLEAAVPGAFLAYGKAIHAGLGGHPWGVMMACVLEGGAVAEESRAALVDWLWTEQPGRNLWRRPVPGMMDLVRDLDQAGVPVGIISNSEGHLAELVAELKYEGVFRVIADSGKLGFTKPGREIFAWTAERLGLPLDDAIVHVGDAYAADVEGAV